MRDLVKISESDAIRRLYLKRIYIEAAGAIAFVIVAFLVAHPVNGEKLPTWSWLLIVVSLLLFLIWFVFLIRRIMLQYVELSIIQTAVSEYMTDNKGSIPADVSVLSDYLSNYLKETPYGKYSIDTLGKVKQTHFSSRQNLLKGTWYIWALSGIVFIILSGFIDSLTWFFLTLAIICFLNAAGINSFKKKK